MLENLKIPSIESKSIVYGKSKEEYRNYEDTPLQDRVESHYKAMRQNQTLSYVTKMYETHHKFDHMKCTIWEAFEKMSKFVDGSDPDMDLPNLFHMIQTANSIKEAGHEDWLQLVGLLHDLGKIMVVWGKNEDGQGNNAPQWGIGGDTFVVGCELPNGMVFPEFNKLNGDYDNREYNTKYGIYQPNTGLKNLYIAYGHDEYMYQMLKFNKCTLPEVALEIIRYHSCYPWHKFGEYTHLTNEYDEKVIKPWVLEFNKYDLYSKSEVLPDVDKATKYYQGLIEKYFPQQTDSGFKLSW